MSTESTAKTHKFKAEVSQVLSLVINSLYSNKDIALRELVSNAADALDKLRFEAIEKPKLLPEDYTARIRLIPNESDRTLTIIDNGIGMGESALAKDLGTVARSGTREFVQKLEEAKKAGDANLIGQFGVGFYSGYLIADKIEVVSRAAGSKKAAKWSSEGQESFTIEPAEREEAGTSVILHLKEDHADFAKGWKLRELVRRYSDFIDYPIELQVEKTIKGEDGEEEKKELAFEAINEASALWTRPDKEVTKEQYEEFYKHLTHDWEPPLLHTHFAVEGTQMFKGLLFLPKRPPFDMLNQEHKHGVRLYVKRVFIMDDCEELLPRWLRFVRGVVDSDDLPLNVSRELLQDSVLVRTIRKQVIRRVLDALAKLAKDDEEAYLGFFRNFGSVLKEGLHFDPSYKDKLGALMRYESSKADSLTSLADYVSRMPEGQKDIYYASGASSKMLASSPHLEGLKQRGYEVLYMTDGVDQWALEGLGEFDDKKLVNAMEAGLDLDGSKDDKAEDKKEDASDEGSDDKKEESDELKALLERCKQVLDEHVSEVKPSTRLTDSPVCLVIPQGGLPAHLERLIRSHQQDMPVQKRILEINPTHPLIQRIKQEHEKDAESDRVAGWIELLYDQALLAEGSPLPDPARFARRMTDMMQQTAGA
ncbi:MAG: molecular chaperone HtpG [Myxococcales bacterium]|nr:molecular chaperone HtpG [Myxococcales bacterium]